MKMALMILSVAALVMLITPPIAVYAGAMDLETSKKSMFAATVVWFGTSPFWMRKHPS